MLILQICCMKLIYKMHCEVQVLLGFMSSHNFLKFLFRGLLLLEIYSS